MYNKNDIDTGLDFKCLKSKPPQVYRAIECATFYYYAFIIDNQYIKLFNCELCSCWRKFNG